MSFYPQRSERFKRAYKKLSQSDQQDVDVALRAMLQDPSQGFLRTKRVQNAKSIKPAVLEASANGNIRITWQYVDLPADVSSGPWKGSLYFRNVGNHDITLNNP